MDLTHENEEDSKYAFLLGSALRNNDTEQLFVVYDNLIPSGIPCTRLEGIKEGARYISELPEEDFNALVLNARTFSLASGRSSSSMASHSGRTTGLHHEEDEEYEVECIMQGEKASTTRYCNLNLDSPFKPMMSKAVDDCVKTDLLNPGEQDSGFVSSGLKNSVGCSESNVDSEEDRPGCFDYTQLTQKERSGEHVRIRPTLNPDYDEFMNVDNSNGGSSVESPRSETSVTHEEYSLENDVEMQVIPSNQDRPRINDGRLASVTAVNEHQHLYGRANHNREDTNGDKWSKPYYDYQTSVEPKKALRSSYNCCQDPVLGGSSGGLGQQKGRVSKRTRSSKDDSDKVTSPVGLDVNGNPSAVDISNYQQMRQPVNASKVGEGGSINTLPNHHSLTTTQTPGGEPPSDLEKKRLRRLKKQEKQKGQLSEAIDDFKGDQSIDDLLSYIEGGNNHKKRGTTSSSNADSPVSGKTDKPKKKQEKGKKEIINGQEKKATTDPSPVKPSPSVTEPSIEVMGNSTGKDCSEDSSHSVNSPTINTTPTTSPTCPKENSTVEDHDQGSGDFYDCFNSLPGDTTTSSGKEDQDTTVKVVLESGDKVSKEDTMVDNKTPKSDKKKSPAIKNNGKESVIATENDNSNKYTLPRQKSTESKYSDLDSICKDSKEKTDEVVAMQNFIEVKKKKKRNLTKEAGSVSNPGSLQQNHSFIPKGSNGPLHSKWRPQRPVPPSAINSTSAQNMVHSNVVKTNNSNLVIKNATDNAFARDLSPSSFPSLMCHNNTSNTALPERRNSCGDINELKTDVSETRSYCDSDKESVKSLPAAHNVRGAGDFPVSYASMAQRHHGECSNSPSSESGIVCGSQNSSINSSHPHSSLELVSPPPTDQPTANASGGTTPDRKTTVWKGSPRERRHSIGSSPDDKPETDKSSINSRNRQKSGSQECLAILTSSHPGSKEAISSGNVDDTNVGSESDADLPSPNSNKPDCSKKVSCSVTMPTSTSPISVGPSNTTKPAVMKYTSVSTPSSAQNPTSLTSSETVGKRNPSRATTVSVPKKITSTVKSGQEAAPRKAISNNTESVIFLDRPFPSKATDLGITFGFDSSIESPVDLSGVTKTTVQQKQIQDAPKSSIVSSSFPAPSSKSAHSSTSQQQQQVAVTSQASGFNIPAIPTRTSGPSSDLVQKHQSSDNHQSPPPSFTNSTSEKMSKGPHKSGPSNGLIVSPSSVIKDSANPKGSTSSATTNSNASYNKNSKGVSQTDKNNPAQGKDSNYRSNISSSNSSYNNSKPCNTSSTSSLPLQTPPTNASEKPSTGTKVAHSVPPNQPQPLNGNGPNTNKHASPHTSTMPIPNLPATTNSPHVMPTTFIGPTVMPLFSPHYPPPPIHQVPPLPPPSMDASVITTIQPSANPTSTTIAATANRKSEIPVSLPSSSSSSSSVASLGTSTPAKNETAKSFEAPIKVVYGLKIKPDSGCGTIFFKPSSHIAKKQKRSNLTDVSGFLKDKWTKYDDEQKKDAEGYITVSD